MAGVSSWWARGGKRIFDLLAGLVLSVVLLPVAAACALLIRTLDGPPVLFRQCRIGRHGASFYILKFRTMTPGPGSLVTSAEDPRITPLGGRLRRAKLDELPQLWNVLRGHMSLVGPRPEDPSFIALHRDEYEQILSVRPGITGYCQLAFARESEILDASDREKHYVERILPQKVRLDCLYAAGRSFAVDIRILWWTAMAVLLSREVAVNRETGRLGRRAPRTAFAYAAGKQVPERSSA